MIEIIPAIDIIAGKCVRLSKGDYEQKTVYYDSPVEAAKCFAGAGSKRLHLVDLDGAKSQHIVNYRVIGEIASKTGLVIDFGGGIKSDEDVRIAFESGASMITGGSIAVKNPDMFLHWLSEYGADRIILGADAKGGKIATTGWLESSGTDILPFIEGYAAKGVRKVISTDIECDGMLQGPSIELYKKILAGTGGIELIASGGVGSMTDVEALNEINVPAVIVGKAIYEGRITLKELENLNLNGIC